MPEVEEPVTGAVKLIDGMQLLHDLPALSEGSQPRPEQVVEQIDALPQHYFALAYAALVVRNQEATTGASERRRLVNQEALVTFGKICAEVDREIDERTHSVLIAAIMTQKFIQRVITNSEPSIGLAFGLYLRITHAAQNSDFNLEARKQEVARGLRLGTIGSKAAGAESQE